VDTDFDILIIKYLDGSASQEEKIHLEEWLKAAEENRALFSEIRTIWMSSEVELASSLQTEIELEKLRGSIKGLISREKTKLGLSGKSRFTDIPLFYKLTQIAAVLLIVLNIFYFFFAQQKPEVLPAKNRLLTAEGSKGRFILPDSTVVWLNSGSVLEYADNFSDNDRNVLVKGEAYFDVRRNEDMPFIVDAGKMQVKVLGTRFLVQNYENHKSEEVILHEGSVEVGIKGSGNMLLAEDQRISFFKADASIRRDTVNTQNYISWINEKLVLDNMALADIIINLERWYNVKIECPEKLSKSVRMSFTVYRESLTEILTSMQLVSPISYRWDEDDTIYISRK